MSEVDATSDDESGSGTPLTASIALTAIVLGVSWTFDLVPPRWLLALTNPVAWAVNAVGLTSLSPGFFVGVAEAVETPGAWLNCPVAGAFIVLLVSTTYYARGGFVLKSLLILPVLIAMQFVVQRGLLTIAESARRHEATDRGGEWARIEARALKAVLSVSRDTGCVGVFFENDAAQPLVRLAQLETKPALADLFETPEPISISYGKISVKIVSDVRAFPTPLAAGTGQYFAKFRQAAATRLRQPVDITQLETLPMGDPRAQLGLNVLIALDGGLRILEALDVASYNGILENGAHFLIHLERGDTELPTSLAKASTAAQVAESVARFQNGTIFITVPEAEYLRGFGEMMDSAVRAAHDTSAPDMQKTPFAQFWLRRIHVPVTHELWHAIVFSTQSSFGALPPIIDEGLACWTQMLAEGVWGMMLAHGEDEKDMVKDKAAFTNFVSESATQQEFRGLIAKATEAGLAPSSRDLFALDDRLYARADVATLYALGWALSLSAWMDQPTFRSALKIWSQHRGKVLPDSDVWPILDAQILTNANGLGLTMVGQ